MFTEVLCKNCGNLVQNFSFESGLESWTADSVTTGNSDPAEGTQVAILGPGVASLFQDIKLCIWCRQPLMLSFIAYMTSGSTSTGNLTVQVLWLDTGKNTISNGLHAFISADVFIENARITYYGITDLPPPGAAFARLLISKGEHTPGPDLLSLDQVILTPSRAINKIQNPSFESGLTHWTSTGFTLNFVDSFEGTAAAFAAGEGTLYQDNALSPFLAMPYLVSFAVSGSAGSTLTARLTWLNAANNQIGLPGLEFLISGATLDAQNGFLSYLGVSEPAPIGAVKARIEFVGNDVTIDQVVLIPVATENVMQNPSFVTLDGWTGINTVSQPEPTPYEGNTVASIARDGGVLFQDVPLTNATGHCFLLNFGLGYNGGRFPNGNIMAEVIWLSRNGNEIGHGLSLVVPLFIFEHEEWLVYAGITEAAPLFASVARIQFSKSAGGTGGAVAVDNVVFTRLLLCE